MEDSTGDTATAKVTVTVTPIEDIMDDTATTPEDTPVDIDVLDNDTFVGIYGDDFEVTDVTDPANGTVTINADGTVTYTPDPDYIGVDTFDYTVTVTNPDGSTTTETATVTVTVTPVEDVMDDTATTPEDTPVDIDVLDNDTFNPNSDVEVTDVTDPANGTVTINADGTVTYTPDPNYNGTDTFDYTVTVTNPDGSTTTETATVIVIVTPDNPSLELLKDGVYEDTNGDGIVNEGDSVIYTFTVTNNGDVPLFNITITDPSVTVLGGPIDLDPGESDSTTFTAVYVITQEDIDAGGVYNLAIAEGTDPDGDPVTDESEDPTPIDPNDPDNPPIDPDCLECTITPLDQDPSIALIKTGTFNDENGDGVAQVGETISYTFTVTNNGNVTVTNIVITDPLTGLVLSGGPIAELDPGETDSTTYTGEYTITQADIDAGSVMNQALATGQDPDGGDVTDESDDDSPIEDDTTITILPQGSSISLVKIGVFNDEDGDGFAQVGETITYTFIVTNTGNVTITNITLDDPLPGLVLSGGPIAELLPGEVDDTTFTGIYTITEEDLINGEVVNQAIATGQDPDGEDVIDISDDDTTLEDDETVTELPQGSITLEKTGEIIDLNGDEFTQAGEIIQYTFKVTNTGNVPLFNITIDDPIVTVDGGPIDLLPGEMDSTTFTATYILTDADIEALMVINQATVTGADQNGNVVTDLSDDPLETANVDLEGDGEPDDPTVIIITGVLNEDDIEIFNGVTPDGDNSNDIFIIRGIENFPDNTVQIFNRWGIEVYFREGYLNDSQGFAGISEGRATLNSGKELPVGTYYYIVKYVADGETRQQAGYLYLNR
ncbi:Ig-like domain-containing protein [Dokdonia sp.]|uniref:DUF7507 domain-containing protein n=1 Tax=Dokdonia sp. TaxID=2024995 RepID=UPI0032679163